MSAEEFRILLKSCQPDSLSIYPGTFLGNEPIEVPEKGAWMSCFSAKHLKRKQSLIVASHSVATNEKLAEILALDDSVVLTPVVFKSASISHKYYVPELEGHNLWVRAEYEENRINLCKECGCHIFGSGLGTYKVRQYQKHFASDKPKLLYCLERNGLVVTSAMKSKIEEFEPKLKFRPVGRI